jgi:hypothetical protein
MFSTKLCQLFAIRSNEVVLSVENLPARRSVEPPQDIEERRLSTPGRSQKDDKLSRIKLKIHFVKGHDGTRSSVVDLGQFFCLKDYIDGPWGEHPVPLEQFCDRLSGRPYFFSRAQGCDWELDMTLEELMVLRKKRVGRKK